MVEKVVELGLLNKQDETKDVIVLSPAGKDEVISYFTDSELRRFFLVIPADKQRDFVLFFTLLGTGKRISEILSVKRKDIDFAARTLKISTLKKRKRTTEIIRLHQDVAYRLSVYCGSLGAEDVVFQLDRKYCDKLAKKYCELAGIPKEKAHCHVFRHTFAVRWLEQGKPIHKLKRHLNHSHINTTMQYLKIVDADYFDTVDSLDVAGFMKQKTEASKQNNTFPK